jgi:hypothetical protein
MNKQIHSMGCRFPEGCQCGASGYNELVDKLCYAMEALRFARRIIGSETENDEAVEKLDTVMQQLA